VAILNIFGADIWLACDVLVLAYKFPNKEMHVNNEMIVNDW
jgi:hypothetical protein